MASYARAILNNQIIISAVDSHDIVTEATRLHGLTPISANALGRMLTVTALMSKQLKNDTDYLTAMINGGGILGNMTTCATKNGNVKGYVSNPFVENIYDENNRLDVARAVGTDGQLTIIKDIGLKSPYTGSVELVTGGIAEDFANYFAVSTQVPCALTLGLNFNTEGQCNAGGGVLIEAMPNCDSQLLFDVETVVYAMDEMSYQFADSNASQVIDRFFASMGELQYIEQSTCQYQCDCSTERIDRVILSVGESEAQNIIDDNGFIEVCCHFCDKKYKYNQQDVDRLFNK